ncbi:MAG: endoribonuclease MazF [Acidiferrobacteraceae bacterium]
MVRGYVSEVGDIVWLHFGAQVGHEQAGHRPAVVVSPSSYNGKTGLMLCCPMTTRIKGYPFEVSIAGRRPGAVLSDQLTSSSSQRKGIPTVFS